MRSYFVPSRLRKIPDTLKLYTPNPQDVIFYLDFNGFLPGETSPIKQMNYLKFLYSPGHYICRRFTAPLTM